MKKRPNQVFILMLTLCFAFGCATPQVSKSRFGPTGIMPQEVVTIEGNEDFIDCVTEGMQGASPNIQVLKQIKKETPKAQLAELSIRYHIYVYGGTSSDKDFVVAGGLMFGGTSWDKNSVFIAKIWDIHNGNSLVGQIETKASGSSFIGIFWIIPIIAPNAVESPACHTLGKEIARFILGEDLQENNSN